MSMFLARIKTKVGEYEFIEFLMLKDYDTQEEAEAAVGEEMKYYWGQSSDMDEDSEWCEGNGGEVMSKLQSVTLVSTFEELVDQIPSY